MSILRFAFVETVNFKLKTSDRKSNIFLKFDKIIYLQLFWYLVNLAGRQVRKVQDSLTHCSMDRYISPSKFSVQNKHHQVIYCYITTKFNSGPMV